MKTAKIEGMEELVGKEEELRKHILAAGLETISERGSVGAHAIEVIWECIVGWDLNVTIVEGVELDPLLVDRSTSYDWNTFCLRSLPFNAR